MAEIPNRGQHEEDSMQTYNADREWAAQRVADGYYTPEEAEQFVREAEEILRVDLGAPPSQTPQQ